MQPQQPQAQPPQPQNVAPPMQPLQTRSDEVHGMLVAAWILAGIPILGLILAIIANNQTKERGKNRELGLIVLISNIIIHAFLVVYVGIVVLILGAGGGEGSESLFE